MSKAGYVCETLQDRQIWARACHELSEYQLMCVTLKIGVICLSYSHLGIHSCQTLGESLIRSFTNHRTLITLLSRNNRHIHCPRMFERFARYSLIGPFNGGSKIEAIGT